MAVESNTSNFSSNFTQLPAPNYTVENDLPLPLFEPEVMPLTAAQLCGKANSCDRCTALAECGWCGLEGKCVEGSKLGPHTEQCLAYDFMHCPNIPCEQRSSCSDCLVDRGCGWCDATQKCAEGDDM